jgi:cob(I)alamin adenosyltransferase
MKIYTKTGDAGETGLYGGTRVSKADPRVEAYGTVDELNAALGLARAYSNDVEVDRTLEELQNALFEVGADLATPLDAKNRGKIVAIDEEDVTHLETDIDRYAGELGPLETFVLPGGNPCAAALHVARAVARRAERRVIFLEQDQDVNPQIRIYLNRVSDLLFTLTRIVNMRAGVSERAWQVRIRKRDGGDAST